MKNRKIGTVKTGYICNNHCKFCYFLDRRERNQTIPHEVLKGEIKELSKVAESITFLGGEPTVREDFFELLNFARSLGFKEVTMHSNGRMFSYPEFTKKAVENGLSKVFISIHSSNSKIHDELTGVKGSFDQTTQGIKNLKSKNIYVGTNTVINRENIDDLPSLSKMFNEMGIKKAEFALRRPNILGGEPDYNKFAPRLIRAIEFLINKDIGFELDSLPFCLLLPHISKIDINLIKKIWEKHKCHVSDDGKFKAKSCAKCLKNEKCDGIWQEYAEDIILNPIMNEPF